jgi:hypothetical protein
MYDLHGPTELCYDIQIGEFGHVRMRVRMHSNVVVERIEYKLELGWVLSNVDTDNKVCGGFIVILKEPTELG